MRAPPACCRARRAADVAGQSTGDRAYVGPRPHRDSPRPRASAVSRICMTGSNVRVVLALLTLSKQHVPTIGWKADFGLLFKAHNRVTSQLDLASTIPTVRMKQLQETTYAPDSTYAWARLFKSLVLMTLGGSGMYTISV